MSIQITDWLRGLGLEPPPVPHASCGYTILFGSGYAGLGETAKAALVHVLAITTIIP